MASFRHRQIVELDQAETQMLERLAHDLRVPKSAVIREGIRMLYRHTLPDAAAAADPAPDGR